MIQFLSLTVHSFSWHGPFLFHFTSHIWVKYVSYTASGRACAFSDSSLPQCSSQVFQVTCPKGHLSEMELCRFRYLTLTLCLYVSDKWPFGQVNCPPPAGGSQPNQHSLGKIGRLPHSHCGIYKWEASSVLRHFRCLAIPFFRCPCKTLSANFSALHFE